MCMYCFYLQVKNIASLFKLDPANIYLLEQIESKVVFPLENGTFKPDQIMVNATYLVHGSDLHGCPTKSLESPGSGIHTPYGAYTHPTFHGNVSSELHPPRSSKTNKIKKSIMVVSLSKKGKQKKGKVEYSVVTQIVVSISPCDCNVPAITQLVTQQLGFQGSGVGRCF